jgi:hypothetical protein
LIHRGFNRKQATNICKAIKANSPEKLSKDAPAWIEWCGKVKRDHGCIVMLAAMGLTTLRIGPGGVEHDLRMGLAKGIELSLETAAKAN